MDDHLLPAWLTCAGVTFNYLESVGVSLSDFGGPPRTASLGGDRLGARLDFSNATASATDTALERRRIMAALVALQGRAGRVYATNPGRRLAGSFPTSELLSNPYWASGLTNWDSSGAEAVVSVADRRLRATRAAGITARSIRNTQSFAVTAYAPYALRALALAGRGPLDYGLRLGTTSGANDLYSLASASAGLLTGVAVPPSTPVFFSLLDGATGRQAGDYQSFDYVSVSRCAVADCAPNLLIYSSDLSQVDWTKNNASIATTSVTLPDGTSGALHTIKEDATAAAGHRVNQAYTASSSAADYCFAGAFKSANRSWVMLRMFEGTGSSTAEASFNLSAGTVGTVAGGANWSNARAFIVSLGDGWYYCAVVGSKTNAATALEARINVGEADADITFNGGNQDSIRVWNPTFAQSSLPVRLSATTTTTNPTGVDQVGRRIYLRGLPASSAGLLYPGDEIEVFTSYGSEYKFVTDELRSDASGRGYLSISPPLRGPLTDGAAIIVNQPLGYWMPTEAPSFDHAPGILTNASIDLQEAA